MASAVARPAPLVKFAMGKLRLSANSGLSTCGFGSDSRHLTIVLDKFRHALLVLHSCALITWGGLIGFGIFRFIAYDKQDLQGYSVERVVWI